MARICLSVYHGAVRPCGAAAAGPQVPQPPGSADERTPGICRPSAAEAAVAVRPCLCGPVVYDHAFRAADGKQRPADPAVHRHYSANNRGICLDFAGGTQYKGIF